jgi:L-ornithine N5-monooxygenase
MSGVSPIGMNGVSQSNKVCSNNISNGNSDKGRRVAKGLPALRSHLSRPSAHEPEEVHDLVCVGFGPASLAIAVALHDLQDPAQHENLAVVSPKVRFLERQSAFHWHAGMLLPGAKMQISFIKDLATLRDPTSYFTFLSYLKQHDRLVQFSNLGTFLPSRLEFEDYLRWAAEHFSHLVDYGEEVDCIRPLRKLSREKYDCVEVRSRNCATGKVTTRLSKNVVIAVGGRPSRPSIFPDYHSCVLHSSEYSTRVDHVLPLNDKAYSIAVVGSGQSAAEVFHDLQSRYPNAFTRLIFRDTALRPSDDSPFVNEIFNPEVVDHFYDQPDEIRNKTLRKNKATNYGVVRIDLLDKIYEDQYMQSVQQPNRDLWQHQIWSSREIVGVVDRLQDRCINLVLKPLDGRGKNEILKVDAVVLATGYERNAHMCMLDECQVLNVSKDRGWQTGRDYGLKLDRSLVAEDVGIWLQGCNESTHGLADSLLSILATRSGELVNSIFGHGGTLHGDGARS